MNPSRSSLRKTKTLLHHIDHSLFRVVRHSSVEYLYANSFHSKLSGKQPLTPEQAKSLYNLLKIISGNPDQMRVRLRTLTECSNFKNQDAFRFLLVVPHPKIIHIYDYKSESKCMKDLIEAKGNLNLVDGRTRIYVKMCEGKRVVPWSEVEGAGDESLLEGGVEAADG